MSRARVTRDENWSRICASKAAPSGLENHLLDGLVGGRSVNQKSRMREASGSRAGLVVALLDIMAEDVERRFAEVL